MIPVTLDNVSQKRTIRPLYAQHQATPYGGFLSASWDRSVDILPGMVCTKLDGENFTLFTGQAGAKPVGLAALFVAPVLGIDETRRSGINVFTVWYGGNQAVFEILAPAFDTTQSWVNATNGSRQGLGVVTSGAQRGKLGPLGGLLVGTDQIATLIQVVGSSKIIVSLDRAA